MPATTERPRYFGDRFPNVDKSFKLPYTVGITGNIGSRTGLASDGVMIGKITLKDPSALLFDNDASAGSQYSNVTSGIAIGGATQTFTVTAADDALYIGYTSRFGGVYIDMNTAGIGSTVTWEYWSGVAWVNLATAHNLIDSSTSFTAGTSNYYATWKIPSNWTRRDVGDAAATITDKFWVRARAAGNYSTDAIVDGIQVMSVTDAAGLFVPSSGYLESVTYTLGTEASNVDMVLNIYNKNNGEVTAFTIPQASRVGKVNVEAAKGLYFKLGHELVLQSLTVAGTPAANASFAFIFRV